MSADVELIYIGPHFYSESKTAMSSLYTVDGGRYDWGFVQRDLGAGKTVAIRPASPPELAPFEARLRKIEKDWGES